MLTNCVQMKVNRGFGKVTMCKLVSCVCICINFYVNIHMYILRFPIDSYFPVDLSIPPTRTLLYLSRGGSDAKVCREFDLALKAFVPTSNGSGDCQYQGFYIPEAKSQVSWVDENTLMVGTDLKDGVSMTDSGYPRVNRLWKRGTSLETESVVCYEGENQDVSVNAYLVRQCNAHMFTNWFSNRA